jgi:hypothetical protein
VCFVRRFSPVPDIRFQNADLVFFDSRGEGVADKNADDDVIFLWKGQPVAILDDESVFALDGRHLGWFMDGWIRDHGGDAVYFTEDATGGPPRPARAARPARGARGARPARGARQVRPLRPSRSLSWSNLSVGGAFFNFELFLTAKLTPRRLLRCFGATP